MTSGFPVEEEDDWERSQGVDIPSASELVVYAGADLVEREPAVDTRNQRPKHPR